MTKRFTGERGVRVLRVGENIRHALADILRRDLVRDPDLFGVSITVSEVNTSPDLKNATIYVLPLSGAGQDKVVKALNKNAAFLRGQLAKKGVMKHMPRLRFELDHSFDEAGRMNALLNDPRVRRDLGEDAPEHEED